MKKIILFLFYSINIFSSSAQGTWTELNALFAPEPYSQLPRARTDPAGFLFGNKLFYTSGYQSDADVYFNDMFDFNLTTNLWESSVSFPGSPRENAVGGILNGKGFITMGYDDNNSFTDSWEFDPSTSLWSSRAAFPGAARNYPFSFVINNKLYAGGGKNVTTMQFYDDFWEYDQATDTWTQKSPVPHAFSGGFGFAAANLGYVVGGTDTVSSFLDSCYVYDPSTDSWTMTANTFPSTWAVNAFGDSSYGYVMDGNILYRMDPVTQSWTQLGLTPQFIYGAVIGNYNGKFYLLCGQRGVYSYDPSTDNWDTVYAALNNPINGRPVVFADTAYLSMKKFDIQNKQLLHDDSLYGSFIFVLDSLGYTIGQFNIYSKYNFQTKTRSPFTPCPLSVISYYFATTDFGYAMGDDSLMQYDPLNDTWNLKAGFPGANRFGGSTFCIGHKAFIACGEDSATYLGTSYFWEYNELTDTWTQRTDVPGGVRIGGLGFSWNGKGVVAFGMSNSAGYDLCDIEIYNDIDSSWTTLNHPLGCRGNAFGFADGQKFYMGMGEIRYSMGYREDLFDFWEYDELPTSINSIKQNDKIIISPNPGSGIFKLAVSADIKPVKLKAVDLLSKVIYDEMIYENQTLFNFNFPPGLYFITITDKSSKEFTVKCIIQ